MTNDVRAMKNKLEESSKEIEYYTREMNEHLRKIEEKHSPLSYLERIKDTAIGAPVKGRFIESLFIGPTDWEQMTDFMNLRIQKGEETALTEFDSAGKSLSVYGVSVNNEFDVPHWDMTIMDNWELMIGN